MSYEGLASRMTQAGCAIQASAIYKIEKADPPRRITVDELVGFSKVFGVPVERLLLPPELVLADELADLVIEWDHAEDKAFAATQAEREAWERVRAWVERHPEHADKVAAVLQRWSEQHYEDGHEFRVAHHMWEITKDKAWGDRAKAALDTLVADRRDS